jgi:hypothetical protein
VSIDGDRAAVAQLIGALRDDRPAATGGGSR